MTVRLALAACALLAVAAPALAAAPLRVTWHPERPRVGDVVWLHVRDVAGPAAVEGSVSGHPLSFFPYAGGYAALTGVDLEAPAGTWDWRVAVLESGREPRTASGRLVVRPRRFSVQRLTVAPGMAQLDPETERRAVAEGERLRTLYRTISPERLWRGRFVRPVAGDKPGSGFGARRVINGQPRMPHGGTDFAAPAGTPVLAANSGRVALTAEYFFPGRLVALDHGLGLYTLYFHLESVAVRDGESVERGQTLGTVGLTGRTTGPHLHFGAQVGSARIDPAALLDLRVRD